MDITLTLSDDAEQNLAYAAAGEKPEVYLAAQVEVMLARFTDDRIRSDEYAVVTKLNAIPAEKKAEILASLDVEVSKLVVEPVAVPVEEMK